MPILNLNGTWRKDRIVHDDGEPLFKRGKSDNQHPSTGVVGKSYESPFTANAVPPLATHFNTATQPQLPAMQVQQPGVVVPLRLFQKVHPSEKGASFNRTKPIRVVNPGGFGSPNPGNDTPANPNKRLPPVARPRRYPTTASEKLPPGIGSFLPSTGHTLHATQNASTTQHRWSTTKKGAAG